PPRTNAQRLAILRLLRWSGAMHKFPGKPEVELLITAVASSVGLGAIQFANALTAANPACSCGSGRARGFQSALLRYLRRGNDTSPRFLRGRGPSGAPGAARSNPTPFRMRGHRRR